jgi:shikimate kinase
MEGIGKTGMTGLASTTFLEMTPSPPASHIVLLGLMGTGKTEAATRLAPRLGLPFTDNDAAIGVSTELNARQIRDRHGTRVLHNLEARHLLDALASTERTVVCAAGSVVEDERCLRALVRPGLFRVWLRATADTLAGRFHNQDHRPLFGSDPLALFTHQIANRSERFLVLADAIVDVDGLTIPQVVDRVTAAIGSRDGRRSRTVELEIEPALDVEREP